jgi:hypothetical protein
MTKLKKLGTNLNFYKGLPEMFEDFCGGEGLLTAEHTAHGITVEHYIIFIGHEGIDRWQQARRLMCVLFSVANSPLIPKVALLSRSAS